MSKKSTEETSRLVVVGVASVAWLIAMNVVADWFDVFHAIVLAVWIAMGSKHYAAAISDFNERLTLEKLGGLVLMAPAWPLLYWQSGKTAARQEQESADDQDETHDD